MLITGAYLARWREPVRGKGLRCDEEFAPEDPQPGRRHTIQSACVWIQQRRPGADELAGNSVLSQTFLRTAT